MYTITEYKGKWEEYFKHSWYHFVLSFVFQESICKKKALYLHPSSKLCGRFHRRLSFLSAPYCQQQQRDVPVIYFPILYQQCLAGIEVPINRLSSVGGGGDVTATAGPVDVDVLALGVLLAGVLGLDAESVGTEVVTLGLEHVGGQVLGAVAVVEGQGGAEGRGGDTPEGTLGDNVTPAVLGLVDGLVEEVVKEQVLEVGVLAVGLGDLLEEDGADDAATAPHEGDLGLLELPAVVLGSLWKVLVGNRISFLQEYDLRIA